MASILVSVVADIGKIFTKVENVALDPVKNTLYYFFPFFGAMSSKYTQITPKEQIKSLMTDESKERIIKEVDRLAQTAKIPFSYNLYTALNQSPMSYGGSLSLTTPVLMLPYEWLIRSNQTTFGTGNQVSPKDINHYSDDETRFLIAKELLHLKSNDTLLKTAAKILLFAAALFLYSTPIGWAGTAAVIAGAILLYLIVDRVCEAKNDMQAVHLVGKTIGDKEKAAKAAMSALNKIREQNLELRKLSRFNRILITQSGNELLDLRNPLLTSRIQALQNHLDARKMPMKPAHVTA